MWPDEWGHRVRMAFAEHSHNLTHNPVRAHWDAAMASTTLGVVMAMARGTVVALMSPPPQRLHTFLRVSNSVAPLYCIPFTLGVCSGLMRPHKLFGIILPTDCRFSCFSQGQYDCYTAARERRGLPPPPVSHAAADLG
jgi:hypothetical protein